MQNSGFHMTRLNLYFLFSMYAKPFFADTDNMHRKNSLSGREQIRHRRLRPGHTQYLERPVQSHTHARTSASHICPYLKDFRQGHTKLNCLCIKNSNRTSWGFGISNQLRYKPSKPLSFWKIKTLFRVYSGNQVRCDPESHH